MPMTSNPKISSSSQPDYCGIRFLRTLTARLGILIVLFSTMVVTRCADNNPPDLMTYQGFLADQNGVPLGNATPINYAAVFRVYDQSTAGVLLWSESQIVTVDKGQFSVILGQGSATGSEPRPALSAVFAPSSASTSISDRYIAVNVTIAGVATEIQPRLRLVPNAYAFTARNANHVIDANGTAVLTTALGRVGINKAPTTALDVNGTVTATSFSGSASGLTGLAASQIPSLDADKITGGTVAEERLSSNVALLNRSPQAFSGNVNSFSGSVGINTTSPTGKLQVNGGVAVTGASSPYAVGTAGLFMEYSSGIANLFAYDYGSGGGGKTLSLNNPGGNVGIGTMGPTHTLHVNGAVAVRSNSGTDGYVGLNRGGNDHQGYIEWFKPGPTRVAYMGYNSGGINNLSLVLENGANFGFLGGNVGIGTANAGGAKLVVSGSVNTGIGTHGYFAWTGTSYGQPATTVGASIYAEGHVLADSFQALSDARTKIIRGQSDGTKDLATLRSIEITDYHYKDVVAKGNRANKKVIAQQVETVFPEAVSRRTEAVPDIYQKASIRDGWVELVTDLKKGERVKLITDKDNGSTHEVLEVGEGKFRIGYRPDGDRVFVFGREVNDFRTVDYEAIAMLNVSATQELARKLEARETELTELRTELSRIRDENNSLAATVSKLEARDEALEARLARLEKGLGQQVGIRQAKATTRE